MNTLQDKTTVGIQGHVLIKDLDTDETLLDRTNAIHLENMAFALASLLANKPDGTGNRYFIEKMHFGNGGTYINDADGLVVYKPTNTTEINDTLYNKTFEKTVDADPVTVGEGSYMTVDKHAGFNYSDIVVTATLDYDEPVDQELLDNETDMESDYVFDEISLHSQASANAESQDGMMLTHIIFHPIQKSANRRLQIIYTIRIRTGSGDEE